MGRLLGIDYGTKRTGFAITDEMKIIATALTTISTHNIDNFIEDFITKNNDIESFVIGFPLDLKGNFTDNTNHVKGFIKRLNNKYPNIPVYKIDERFTSKIAKHSILTSGVKKKIRRDKKLVDKVSATIILQNYLDYSQFNFGFKNFPVMDF